MSIAVVIPSFRVSGQILDLLPQIGAEVQRIFVVDDCCPERSGELVQKNCKDPRVKVLFHNKNLGVGGALVTGYRAALLEGWDIIVKLDGDGQMDPALIPGLVAPIQSGEADYCKGNRFYSPRTVERMPAIRLFGNSVLSFVAKAATGYWQVMDSNNGFTAIHAVALRLIPLDKIDRGYFFETDMLFRLNTIQAVVLDFPMVAIYEDEESNLSISKVLMRFPLKYAERLLKRVLYMYYIRDFNVASLQLVLGLLLLLSGTLFGSYSWIVASMNNQFSSSGTVMIAGLQIILGVQLLLAAISFDVSRIPSYPLSKKLRNVFRASNKKEQNYVREVVG